MVYRLYVETVKYEDRIAWAFTFYNHQDFMVYKRAGVSENTSEKSVILEQSGAALTYFERSMRRRYYDEHFSTRIDEDYVTLYTEIPEISEVAEIVKNGNSSLPAFIEDREFWEILLPFFKQKTMSFEFATDEKFISAAKELAKTKK
ncbi:MAG: hypothetical protein IKU61_03615 [Clostridia bacterium]|nr:hypothetical protein [Clostridia bacterium]